MKFHLVLALIGVALGRSEIRSERHYVDDGCQTESDDVPNDVNGTYLRDTALAAVRCCSKLIGAKEGCITIGSCPEDFKTYEAAVAECALKGHRLCSKNELLSGVCCGTGGYCDNYYTWTSTVYEPPRNFPTLSPTISCKPLMEKAKSASTLLKACLKSKKRKGKKRGKGKGKKRGKGKGKKRGKGKGKKRGKRKGKKSKDEVKATAKPSVSPKQPSATPKPTVRRTPKPTIRRKRKRKRRRR